jgi:hypothetical protein
VSYISASNRKELRVPILPRIPSAHHVVAVGTAVLIALAGCDSKNSPGEAIGHEEEHAGHVIPAHKPKAFPDAVRQLRKLNDQLLRQGSEEGSEASTGPSNLQIALDTANWLPEIAADSDMPEPPWNEGNARSARLVADYQTLIAGDAAHARTELEQADAEIGKLEKLLLSCEPRWFDATGKIESRPATAGVGR